MRSQIIERVAAFGLGSWKDSEAKTRHPIQLLRPHCNSQFFLDFNFCFDDKILRHQLACLNLIKDCIGPLSIEIGHANCKKIVGDNHFKLNWILISIFFLPKNN